ncbi:MAG: tetratricopeptide repeat protein [Prochlorococcus sp.]
MPSGKRPKGFVNSLNNHKATQKKESAKLSDREINAISLLEKGKLYEAESVYREIIDKGTDNQINYLNLAVIYGKTKRYEKALELLLQALEIKPNCIDSLVSIGTVHKILGNHDSAVHYFNKALAVKPESHEILIKLGDLYQTKNQLDTSIVFFKRALELKPNCTDTLYNMGNVYQAKGELNSAIDYYSKALSIKSELPDILNNLGLAFQGKGDLDAAIDCYFKALSTKEECPEVLNNLGLALQEKGDLDAAIDYYNKSLTLNPNSPGVLNNIGFAFQAKGDSTTAIDYYYKAISIQPDCHEALYNLGNASQANGAYDVAVSFYNKALSVKHNYPDALNNIGLVLQQQGDLIAAINSYNKALSFRPDHPETLSNLGTALRKKGDLAKAIDIYNNALAIKPYCPELLLNLGNALQEQAEFKACIETYTKALTIDPNSQTLKAALIYSKSHVCDWSSLAEQNHWLKDLGIEGDPVPPFSLLALEDEPQKQLIRAQRFFDKRYPMISSKVIHKGNSKLRIGYFSADFYTHATMNLMSRIFEQHDKNSFEVFAYAYGPFTEDETTKRLKEHVYLYRDFRYLDDIAAVSIARNDNLDIAVDLKGYTKDNRLGIFALNVAPLQISYLGYPGTTGAKCMDYILADKILIPEGSEKYYSEKVIFMPNSYQCNDETKYIPSINVTRVDHGLPKHGFIFTCFNKSYKITPREFNIWMRLLHKVEHSIIWLFNSNEYAKFNLRKEAEKRGISPSRLIFANRMPLRQHLERHKLGDLFLDTFNVNAHTTASDALMTGLPVLTLPGKSFAARVGASLLAALNLHELIASSEEEYEEKAYKLASDPKALSALKAKIISARESSSLFNSAAFTRDLERTYINLIDLSRSS